MEEVQWFTQQVMTYEPSMYRLAMSILGNTEDAADAAQEAILIAYQKLHTLRQKESFRPWLMKILTNECYALLKKDLCKSQWMSYQRWNNPRKTNIQTSYGRRYPI